MHDRTFAKKLAYGADEYLQSAQEMYQAVESLLDSELYTFYYERMVGIMMVDAQEVSSFHISFCDVVSSYAEYKPT